jgi:acyl-CoA thioesterase-1
VSTQAIIGSLQVMAGRLARLAGGLVVLAVVASCKSNVSPAPTVRPEVTIVVLGDSLALAPSRAESFPAVLETFFHDRQIPAEVVNAGVDGDTTADGVRRLNAALAGDVDVLVVELGANDGLYGVRVPTVERNLAEIIEGAQQRGIRVLLCAMEAPPFHAPGYSLEFHWLFLRLSEKYSIPLVPFFLTDLLFNPQFTAPDGVHPNAAGARRIAEAIWPYLEPIVTALNSAAPTATGIRPWETDGVEVAQRPRRNRGLNVSR